MQLSHTQKSKITHIGDEVKHALLHAQAEDIIDLRGAREVNIHFEAADTARIASSLANVGIEFDGERCQSFASLDMASYRPDSLRAAQLVALLDDPLVSSISRSQEMEILR